MTTVDDAIAAGHIGEAGHRSGSAADLAEGALDYGGGAYLDPVCWRHDEKI